MKTVSEQFAIIERHQAQPPVQTVPIAKELGLGVYKSNPNAWEPELSGIIKKMPGGNYNIYVNGDHHVHRRRFTIAHEISHFILHRDMIGDGFTDDALYRSSGVTNHMERQANYLAANILMPWDLINAELEKGVSSIKELAETFRVSLSSMSIRLGVPHEGMNIPHS